MSEHRAATSFDGGSVTARRVRNGILIHVEEERTTLRGELLGSAASTVIPLETARDLARWFGENA